jgi:hypothetical protein
MPDLAVKVVECMENAKRTAVGSYHQVLENGDEVCTSESDSESSESSEVDESEAMENISAGCHQVSAAQVLSQRMTHARSQPRSENRARVTSAFASWRSLDSKASTTQARPRETGYVCHKLSPFPHLGTAAGSCEPTTQPSSESRAPTPANSDDDNDMSYYQMRHLVSAKRKEQKGRAGGLVAGRSGGAKTDTRVTTGHPSHTSPM